jgi:hypothetical protein
LWIKYLEHLARTLTRDEILIMINFCWGKNVGMPFEGERIMGGASFYEGLS